MVATIASSEYLVENRIFRKRYAVLVTGHASAFTIQKYGDYGKMFIELLRCSEDELWDVFYVIDNQFPSQDQLFEYDGYVITGSRKDAHGEEEWILKLCEVLRQLHKKKIKLLGICFGHQVLSRALGGKTGRNPGGWDIGVKKVFIHPQIKSKPYAAHLPSMIKILGTHRDQVSEIPPEAEIAAWSEFTKVEMFTIANHVLAIQGHPEFRKDIIYDTLKYRIDNGIVPEDVGRRALESMKSFDEDKELLRNFCRNFLRHEQA